MNGEWASLDTWTLAGLALALVLLGAWLARALGRRGTRRRVAGHRRAGVRGEARAEALLRAGGYEVLDRQVAGSLQVVVDGEREAFGVRADFLVSRRGRTYVAEAKGGEAVATIAHRGTRRQLLEYAHAFAVDGVLLVDAVRGRVHRIGFEPAQTLD